MINVAEWTLRRPTRAFAAASPSIYALKLNCSLSVWLQMHAFSPSSLNLACGNALLPELAAATAASDYARSYRRQSSPGNSRGNAAACARSTGCSRRFSTRRVRHVRVREMIDRGIALRRAAAAEAPRAQDAGHRAERRDVLVIVPFVEFGLVLRRDIHRDEQTSPALPAAPARRRAGSARLRSASCRSTRPVTRFVQGDPFSPPTAR